MYIYSADFLLINNQLLRGVSATSSSDFQILKMKLSASWAEQQYPWFLRKFFEKMKLSGVRNPGLFKGNLRQL